MANSNSSYIWFPMLIIIWPPHRKWPSSVCPTSKVASTGVHDITPQPSGCPSIVTPYLFQARKGFVVQGGGDGLASKDITVQGMWEETGEVNQPCLMNNYKINPTQLQVILSPSFFLITVRVSALNHPFWKIP